MSATIAVLKPGDPEYEATHMRFHLDRSQRLGLSHPLTPFYDEVCAQYNAAPVGALLVVNRPAKFDMGNFRRTLVGRGLSRGDFAAHIRINDLKGRPLPKDATRPVELKKLTSTTARIIL